MKKYCKKKPNIFHLKIDFIDDKYFFKLGIGYILINLNNIFPMNQLEFKISILVEIYEKKTAGNDQNCHVKAHTFQTIKYINAKFL